MLYGYVKPGFTAVADAFLRTLPDQRKRQGALHCVCTIAASP
jgi:hypothetical protein